MARKLGWLLIWVALALPASAAVRLGSISGYVKNSAGVPQMGTQVEVVAAATSQATTVYTDVRGFYAAAELLPGLYYIKVSAPSFLPSLRENISLRAGAHLVIDLTQNTLFEAVQLLPPRRSSPPSDDDWKWTLRSVAGRPILRVLDNGPLVVSSGNGQQRTLKARVAFVAGAEAEGFGGSADMSTDFRLEQSIFSSGTLSLDGNVGHGSGTPAAVVRAGYSHQMPDGSHPEVALTVRRFASPNTALHNAALSAMAVSVSDGITLADFVELSFGGEMQTVQFGDRVTAFRPFGSVAVHLSPNTVLQYQYATSPPNTRSAKGFDTAPADLSESGPRMSIVGGLPQLERARHQEISISRRIGGNNFQVGVYSDHIANAALVGAGEVTAESGEFLPDVYSGTFTYNGGDLAAKGLRVVMQRRITPDLVATMDYGYGGVIDLERANMPWQEVQSSLHHEHRHALAAKVAGRVPRCNTRWIATYKWTSGQTLTPVDLFNASPGQADPYLNIFVRQPIPGSSFLPGRMEALIDLRNLLAQGYVPVIAQDGQTLYLVQSARAIRGGLAFTF